MRPVLGPGGDPSAQYLLIAIGKRILRRGRRHDLGLLGRGDAPHKFAYIGSARHDRPLSRLTAAQRRRAIIQPKFRLPRLVVRPMTFEAMFGQNRPNVAAEADTVRAPPRGRKDYDD